jgi:chromosome partitioning protein
VAVLGLKGGVGKTSVVLGLAGAALQRKIRTLVVDLDPQGNCTGTLEPGATTSTLADVLSDPARSVLRNAIAPSAWGEGLDVLVGGEETEAHNRPDPDRAGLGRLDHALSMLDTIKYEPTLNTMADKPPYRLVLLDCPPSLGALTRSALVAAEGALLVTEPTVYSVAGVQRAFEAVQHAREHNPDLHALGVVVNRVRVRSSEHHYRINELREIFGSLVLSTVLPDCPAVQHAQGAGLPIQRWGTPGAREVAVALDVLLARILRARQPGRRTPMDMAQTQAVQS